MWTGRTGYLRLWWTVQAVFQTPSVRHNTWFIKSPTTKPRRQRRDLIGSGPTHKMSAAFTTPADQTWQTLLDELTLAYSERRQALGQSAYTPTDSNDVQDRAFWNAIAAWVLNNCINFIDHVHGPLNAGGTDFLYWTQSAFLTETGMFRRAVEWDGISDPVWLTDGPVSAGDIIGPWIFEDLQNGFGALKWTYKPDTTTDYNTDTIFAIGNISSDCVENRANFDAKWLAQSWTNIYADILYYIQAEQVLSNALWFARRYRGKAVLTNIPTMTPHSANIYFLPKSVGGYPFEDIEGLGLTENQFWFFESIVESSSASHVSSFIGNTTGNPFVLLGWTCPAQDRARIVYFRGSYWLLKWNFTNA